MKTPEGKTIIMTFHSHPTTDMKMRWIAKITFPPGSTAETVLPITIVDGEELPVESGVFEFAGQKLTVKDGEASMTFAQFVAGKHSVPIWLHRDGMKPIPGVPTFG